MGESFGAYFIGSDDEIIRYVTTANVACGWYGRDPMVMDKMVRKAVERRVVVGVRPDYLDLMRLGRCKMVLKPLEVKSHAEYQVGVSMALTAGYGMKPQHVAPHGALENLCQCDEDVSRAIYGAVYEVDPSIRIFYCAGAVLGDEAGKMGLEALSEASADRAYMNDLSLVPREMGGAMIIDEDEVIRWCVGVTEEGKVTSVSGKELDIKGDILCVRGGGAEVLTLASRIRDAFEAGGIQINNSMGGRL